MKIRINEKEVLRYAGVRGEPDEGTLKLVRRAVAIAEKIAEPRFCTAVLSVKRQAVKIFLGGEELCGASAHRLLEHCSEAALITATAGHYLDAELRRLSVGSPALAFMLDAVGTALVEEATDEAERAIKRELKEGARLTRRFSPGYGDMPLAFNAAILRLTDAERRVGVTGVNGKMLAPSKSVTAIAGIIEEADHEETV